MPKNSNKKVIITAALTGAIHTPTMSPYLPITPQQLIDEAIAVHEAGGAVAHLHVRDSQNGYPAADQDVYREIATEVKKTYFGNTSLFACAFDQFLIDFKKFSNIINQLGSIQPL